MASLLPQTPGLLPYWLLMLSLTSFGNTISSYSSMYTTTEVYSGPSSPSPPDSSSTASAAAKQKASPSNKPQVQVTPLQARTFGTWTLLSSVVRFYAAYHISDKAMYEVTMWSFVVAWAHYASEWLLYRTVRPGRASAGQAVFSTTSLIWMGLQYGAYVK